MNIRYAQTNVQLIQQMQSEGYLESDLAAVVPAYNLAAALHTASYRSMGKPFVAHVVGTASILVARKLPIEVVTAAVLHGAYSHGDFGDFSRGAGSRRRSVVRDVIGVDAEAFVYEYWQLPWGESGAKALLERLADLSQREREVVILRLADELDDYLDGGMIVAPRQLARKGRREAPIVELAQQLACDSLASELKAAHEEARNDALPESIRSAHAVSYTLPPKSYRLGRKMPWHRAA